MNHKNTTREALSPAHVQRLDQAACTFAAQGDEPSFKVLYIEVRFPLSDALRDMGVPEGDIDDVISLTRIRLWNLRARFVGSTFDAFVRYAVTIAKRELKSWRRSEARQHRAVEPLSDACALFAKRTDLDESGTPEDIVAAREVLRTLSDIELHVVKARSEGYTLQEVADETGLSIKRVRGIYERVLKFLREAP